jgi:hypothetical protein
MPYLLSISSVHTAFRFLKNQFYPVRQFLQYFVQALHAPVRTLVHMFQVEPRPRVSPATGGGIQVQTQNE